MDHYFMEFIDMDTFTNLMESFYALSHVSYALIDIDGKILSQKGWLTISHDLHVNAIDVPLKAKLSTIMNQSTPCNEYFIYPCKNNLTAAWMPISIKQHTLATLWIGHFYHSSSNTLPLRKEDLPILSSKQLKNHMNYYQTLLKHLCSCMKEKLSFKTIQNENQQLIHKLHTCKQDLANTLAMKDLMEEKFIQSTQKYKILVELFPYGLCLRNKDKVLFANQTAAHYFGYEKAEDIMGKKPSDLFEPHPDYKHSFEKNFKKIFDSKLVYLAHEKLIRKKDGQILNVETAFSVLPSKNEDFVLIVFRNISHKIEMEELKQEVVEKELELKEKLEFDRLRMEFFANLSHEIKTPIHLISSTIQLLEFFKEQSLSTLDPNHFHILRQNCNRLLKLTDNLIDITKIGCGYFSLHPKNINIVYVIEEITRSTIDYMKKKDIHLIFDTNVEEKILTIDPYSIERIMLNLLSNSLKFSNPHSKVYVILEGSKDEFKIIVKDLGIGIPKNQLELIFDHFRQVDKSLARKQEGSGMGLSLVKALVEFNNGSIHVESTPAKGSTFTLIFPCSSTTTSDIDPYDTMDLKNNVAIEFSDIYLP